MTIMFFDKYLFFLSVLITQVALAQKKPLTNDIYNDWQSLKEIDHNVSSLISNDGRYFAYTTTSRNTGDVTIISSISPSSIARFSNAQRIMFTDDSRDCILLLPGDTVAVVDLLQNKIKYWSNVSAFELPQTGKDWIVLSRADSTHKLTLISLKDNFRISFDNVESYVFDRTGEYLFYSTMTQLFEYDLKRKNRACIKSTGYSSGITFEESNKQMVFHNKNGSLRSICFYEHGMDSAQVIINQNTRGFKSGWDIEGTAIKFVDRGKRILFKARAKDDSAENIGARQNLDISYVYTNSEESNVNIVTLSAEIKNPNIVKLTDAYDEVLDDGKDISLLVVRKTSVENQAPQNNGFKIDVISARDGMRSTILTINHGNIIGCSMSPNGKFIIWYNSDLNNYFTYEIKTGEIYNITSKIAVSLRDEESDIISKRLPFGVGGWLAKEGAVLIYDKFDIWKVSPSNGYEPKCITKFVGRDRGIVFRVVETVNKSIELLDSGQLLVAGLNIVNKDNGFWSVNLAASSAPKKLTMGPYVYYFPRPTPNILASLSDDIPQKAKYANLYIVKRMSVTESPNLFATTDFSEYRQLTFIKPEADYNWLRSELVKWSVPGVGTGEGILLKPENFDSTRRYPVIFNYYEKLSNTLNVYRTPDYSNGTLNAPWYVSNGFLVFIPNIYYETGRVARSITNTILSAVHHLSQFYWVDSTKMGLQGHSFGGFETLTLITHTNIFTAAQESAGYVNSISYYNYGVGTLNRNRYYEIDQGNLGCSPWDCPSIYIENSPIFHLKSISTPLLIMHNEQDGNVPFVQAVELYSSMKKLNKRVWMLQYSREGEPREGHLIYNRDKQLNFTVKQQEFFRYYLKGGEMPQWLGNPQKMTHQVVERK